MRLMGILLGLGTAKDVDDPTGMDVVGRVLKELKAGC